MPLSADGLRTRSVGLVCLAAGLSVAAAAHPASDHDALFTGLGTEDGLSSAVVYSIDQDRTGFIWLGTEAGLDRYDGTGVSRWNLDPERIVRPPADDVADVHVGADGELWIATWGGGLVRLDTRSGQVQRYLADATDATSLPDDRLQVVLEDSAGTLWIGTFSAGLARFDPSTATATTFRHVTGDPSSLAGNRVWSICESPTGVLWIGTNGGLTRLATATGETSSFVHDPSDPRSLPSSMIRAVIPRAAGGFWIGTEQGLGIFNPDDATYVAWQPHEPASPALDGIAINVLYEGSDRLWIGTYGHGLLSLDSTGDGLRSYSSGGETGLGANDIRALSEDRTGVLWIGSRGGGVRRLPLRAQRFEAMVHSPARPDGPLPGRVMAFAEDRDGAIWVAGSWGLSRLSPAEDTFVHYQPDPDDESSLESRVVRDVLVDSRGSVWVATWRGLARLVDPGRGRFELLRHDPSDAGSLGDDRVCSLYEDRRGRLWVGTYSDVESFDPETGRFSRIALPTVGENPGWVTSILEIHGGQIWIGTDTGGLYALDPE